MLTKRFCQGVHSKSIQSERARTELANENERQYQFYRGQGDVLFLQQQWEEALKVYTSALELRPGDAFLEGRIAVARDSMEAIARAAAAANRLVDLIERATDENGIFIAPDTPAQMLDEAALREGVRYPVRARRAGVEGRVILRMVVDEEGRMQDPVVVQEIGFGCEEEVMRLLQEARFEPATFNGAPVKAWYMFSLVFSLDR